MGLTTVLTVYTTYWFQPASKMSQRNTANSIYHFLYFLQVAQDEVHFIIFTPSLCLLYTCILTAFKSSLLEKKKEAKYENKVMFEPARGLGHETALKL